MDRSIGFHLLADFWQVNIIDDPHKISALLRRAAEKARVTVLTVSVERFSGQGITGVALLKESHISIHSWPESDYLAIDIFTCGRPQAALDALECLEEAYQPQKKQIKKIPRGVFPTTSEIGTI
ncbi:MAG: adenosylmethionine decarboxylase [Deltaproteobacteria bacterium]|nr:adenosylmethionine decarboxylase [Deltaproteobacteria bacterium]